MSDKDFLNNFDKISRIGWFENEGLNRLALNEYDIKARDELILQLSKIDAEINMDDAGNIYGSIGNEKNGMIAIGSHMDSVPNGGRFDGTYGVVSGLQMLKVFSKSDLNKKIMVIDFTNEEGARWQPDLLGSGLATGVFDQDFVYSRTDKNNRRFGAVLKKTRYYGSSENRIKYLKPEYYIEPHIEQGPILEKEGYIIGIPVGIVTDIVENYTFAGESNQAGPTPMNMRKDALVGASKFIFQIYELARKIAPNLVMTVGDIKNLPNVYNVIPGSVKLTLDIRSPDKKLAYQHSKIAKDMAEQIASENGLNLTHEVAWRLDTTLFDQELTKTIEKVCKQLNLKYKFIYSWPTHDAMYMNKITRTAMIMIPSHNGRSHTKEEYSRDSDLISGLKVLKNTLNKLML